MPFCCSRGAPASAAIAAPASTSYSTWEWTTRRRRVWIAGAADPRRYRPSVVIRASVVGGSSSSSSSSEFARRIEQAWLISQQPRPIVCSTCKSKGHVECKWCRGTGFFILGDNMLCEVPSRNTTCLICAGEGSACCSDCKGTGFRAKWLGEPIGRSR